MSLILKSEVFKVSGQLVRVLRKNVTIKQMAQEIAKVRDAQGIEKPFFLVDCGRLKDLWNDWRHNLPKFHPYFAIKANHDPVILQCMSWLGANFDCASPKEINRVLSTNTAGDRIIYANPYKSKNDLKFAQENGVTFTTFDTPEELAKIKQFMPNAKALLRISCPDASAKIQLGEKFGCDAEKVAPQLLKLAADLELNVAGICFHIGSNCRNSGLFDVAIKKAAKLLKIGQSLGLRTKILDIGGGFPGFHNEDITFEEIAKVVRESCEKYFDSDEVQLIAEPGRYFCESVCTLCCNVVAQTKVWLQEDANNITSGYQYVLNDGVSNSFVGCIYEKDYYPSIEPLCPDKTVNKEKEVWSIVYGPTCDSQDKIRAKIKLPLLECGQWVISKNLGSYSMTRVSEFNDFPKPEVLYFISDDKSDFIRHAIKEKHI